MRFQLRNGKSGESGAIMLEGMIVMVITMLLLVWILGVGFLYYQKYVVRIATNDAAEKVASTYYQPTSDIIMGYVNANDLSDRSLYFTPELSGVNQARANAYVLYQLKKANFANTVKDVKVSLTAVGDRLGRSHVVVTTTCTFRTPFGEGLELFGMNLYNTYSVTAYADSTNLTDYISQVNLNKLLFNGTFLKGTGFVEKAVKFTNSLIKMINH